MYINLLSVINRDETLNYIFFNFSILKKYVCLSTN